MAKKKKPTRKKTEREKLDEALKMLRDSHTTAPSPSHSGTKTVEVDVKCGDHHHTEHINVPSDANYQEIQNQIVRQFSDDGLKKILSIRVPNPDGEEGSGGGGSGSGGPGPGTKIRYAAAPGAPKVKVNEDGELELIEDESARGIKKLEKEEYDSKLGLMDSVLAQKVKSIIEDNRLRRTVPNTRSGKLNTRSLWRAKTGRDNLFKKAQERKGKDYHVTIMVDQSGSMRGWAEDAHRACILAANSLISAGCDVEIFGFYMDDDDPDYWQKTYGDFYPIDEVLERLPFEAHLRQYLKDNEKHFNSEELLNEMNTTFSGSGNADYESLTYMYRRLAKIEGKEKVLLVITDGNPTSPYNHSFNDSSALHSLITSQREVKTMALAINSAHVKSIYPQYAIVDNVEDFNQEFTNLLERNIKRGL